ncbi:MAG TPA: class I SAM-dependent methyltransferase [Xanthobacteraceae bacterium]|nr:class I SAM-dependent methyltransferase [Xanthobacteraceae bacterium]
MSADLDKNSVEQAYARWAPVYDLVFDKVMAAGRREAVAAALRAGTRIADVGIGTGLELRYFTPETRVVGIDLSEPMLRKAQARAQTLSMRHLLGLCVMDAARLGFADGTFDAVVAPYVITVVPNPEATLDELLRVVRPGGEIVLVNHIGAQSGPRAAFERWLARQTRHLGWRPEFPWERIARWLAGRPDAMLAERRTVPPFGLFTLVRLRKRAVDAQPGLRSGIAPGAPS